MARASLRTHHVFLLARLIPKERRKPRYRCVGAISRHWCFGKMLLQAVQRFITLINKEENAQIILEELHSLNGQYGAYGDQPPIIPEEPCPFATFLLSSAWGVNLDIDNFIAQPVQTLEASRGSVTSGIFYGITVIDITNPASPSYCFVSHRPSNGNGIPQNFPLSAAQYAHEYYVEFHPDDREDISPASRGSEIEDIPSQLDEVKALNDLPLVSLQMLNDAWPSEYDHSDELIPDEEPTVPPLSSLTLKPALEQAMINDSSELFHALETWILLPEKLAAIKDALISQPKLTNRAVSLIKLIIEAREDKRTINLSGFQLSENQFSELFGEAGQEHFNLVQVVDISHNSWLNPGTLKRLLSLFPNLHRLVLLQTSITNEQIIQLMESEPFLFYRIQALVHPAFLSSPSQATYPSALTVLTPSISLVDVDAVSLPYFTPNQLVQGFLDYLVTLSAQKLSSLPWAPGNGGILRESLHRVAYAAQVRDPEQPWDERVVPYVPSNKFILIGRNSKNIQWFFVLRQYHDGHYAFGRINKRAAEEYFNEKTAIEPMEAKENRQKLLEDLEQSFKTRLYDLFDIQSFFRELQLEGRPSPDPVGLSKVLDIFGSIYNSAMHVMSREAFFEILVKSGVHETLFGQRSQAL